MIPKFSSKNNYLENSFTYFHLIYKNCKVRATMSQNTTSIRDILGRYMNECQYSEAIHPQYVISIGKLFAKNYSETYRQFIKIINKILIISRDEVSVDRIIKFIAKVVISRIGKSNEESLSQSSQNENLSQESDNDLPSLIDLVIKYLIEVGDSNEKVVRWRSSQIIANIIKSLGTEATLE